MYRILDSRLTTAVLACAAFLFIVFVGWRYDTYLAAVDAGLAEVLSGAVSEDVAETNALAADDVPVTFTQSALVVGSAYPGFAVKFSDGLLKQYTVSDSGTVSDADVTAAIIRAGRDQWQLTLTTKVRTITQVYFPWEAQRNPLNPDRTDAVIYHTLLLGTAKKDSALIEWGWEGWEYPGAIYAPLMVSANDIEAKIVAATNWPPRTVTPLYSLNRLTLRYEQNLAIGTPMTYRALIAKVKKKNKAGAAEAWQTAVDKYRSWLDRQLKITKIEKPIYPDWVNNSHGWINVQLENRTAFNSNDLQTLWNKTHRYFPWMQMWGQMSTYAGPPQYAVPPPLPGELVGCCADISQMHSRYIPTLPAFTASTTLAGGRVGYYSRPHLIEEGGPLFATSSVEQVANTGHLLNWVARNGDEYKANAHYIDIFARKDFGDILTVARFLRDRLPQGSVIEGVNDIYPGAFLISGFLDANNDVIDEVGGTRTRFPRFGRYFLNEQAMFLGESNGGHAFWGAPNNYVIERQAFLLGAKLDIMRPYEFGQEASYTLNTAVKMVVDKRNEKNWWARKPVYMDRVGLSNIPVGVDIRHFKGENREDLFVIDNWQQQAGLTFTFKNRPLTIPTDKLSILVWRGGRLE
ncbi:MAG: hypothetical protein EXS68_02820 [Candidatus Ryanbacteria bacterium]|nr:hypothetical protein [Candidatus Ryanbacteria bacterium]